MGKMKRISDFVTKCYTCSGFGRPVIAETDSLLHCVDD